MAAGRRAAAGEARSPRGRVFGGIPFSFIRIPFREIATSRYALLAMTVQNTVSRGFAGGRGTPLPRSIEGRFGRSRIVRRDLRIDAEVAGDDRARVITDFSRAFRFYAVGGDNFRNIDIY